MPRLHARRRGAARPEHRALCAAPGALVRGAGFQGAMTPVKKSVRVCQHMIAPKTARRTYQMLENESLWALAERVHGLLAGAGIDHAIVGGVAVCLHGYRRNTVDLDLLIRPEDTTRVRVAFETEGFQWIAASRDFASSSGAVIP